MKKTKTPGRLLAWAALLVALAASVAANVAFARPAPGPRLSAGVAPVLVVLAAGLLERVPLGGIRWWRRWLAYGGLSVVVVAAFVTSFEHQYRLLVQYGNPATSAVLLPVAVDGLIVLASVCLTVIAERRRELSRDVTSNIATQPAKATRTTGTPAVSDRMSDTPSRAEQPKRTRKPATTAQRIERLRDRQPELSVSAIARKIGVTERTVARHLTALAQASDTTPVNGADVPELIEVSA